jgi:dihydroneopterin aldolase
MSLPDSPTTSPVPLESVTIREPQLVPDLLEPTVDYQALVKIIADLVAQKPTTPAEALKLLGTLQIKIAEWVVSDLPEKDNILAGLKMAETVAASVGCLPCLRKTPL